MTDLLTCLGGTEEPLAMDCGNMSLCVIFVFHVECCCEKDTKGQK